MTKKTKIIVVLFIIAALIVGYIVYLQIRLQAIYSRISSQEDFLKDINSPSIVIDKYSGADDVGKVIDDANKGLYQASEIEDLLSGYSDEDLENYLDTV